MTVSSINAITAFTSDMLQENFGLTSVEAGNCFGYIYMVSGGSLVLTGVFCDAKRTSGLDAGLWSNFGFHSQSLVGLPLKHLSVNK